MFFHPDDALSVDELLQKIYDERLPAPAKAHLLAQAEARGTSGWKVMHELVEEWREVMENPSERENWLRISQEMDEQKAMPFGPDPRVKARD